MKITDDELNEVPKDLMVNSICNRYVLYDTMTDMIMALNKGDIGITDREEYEGS